MQTQGTHHIRHRHAAVAKLCNAARLYTRDRERKRGRECETVRERECEKEHEDKVKDTIYLKLRSCKRNLHAARVRWMRENERRQASKMYVVLRDGA